MFTEKQRNLFAELNLPALQKYVSSLASQYPDSIERIVLHRFVDPEHEYLLVFELSDDEEARTALLNSMALELSEYEKHLPSFYLDRGACDERDWLFLPIFERDPRYSELTIKGGGVTLFDAEARGGCHNIPQHTTSGFYRKGDFWRIVYNGKEAILSHVSGLYYVGYLLSTPNTRVTAKNLYLALNGTPIESGESFGDLTPLSSLEIRDDSDPETVSILKQEVKKAYHNFRVAQEHGNEERIKRRREQYEERKEILREYGLVAYERGDGSLGFRRVKPANKYTDNLRKAVGLAGSKLIKEIPELKKHLNCIQRKGNELIYIPLETDETEFIFRP